jgi:hypothetical protein
MGKSFLLTSMGMNEEKMKNVPEGFICQQFTDILIISERGTIGKGDGLIS